MEQSFLICALFFPRLTLLYCWLQGCMPVNTTPFFVDILSAALMPRFLIAFWMLESNQHPLLIFLFVLTGFREMFVVDKAKGNKNA